jgi:hypothetical protein
LFNYLNFIVMAETTAPKTANPLLDLAKKAASNAAQSREITLRSDATQFDALNGKMLAEFLVNHNVTALSKANSVFTAKDNTETRTPILIAKTPHGKVIIHMSRAVKEEVVNNTISLLDLVSCTFRKTYNLFEENAEGKVVPRADAVEVLLLTKPGNGRVTDDEEELTVGAE